jgi:hypothetical protein
MRLGASCDAGSKKKGISTMRKGKRAPFEFHPLKIDPKPGELPDFVGTSSEPPDFVRRDAGMVTENIGPDDIVWLAPGADGELAVRLPTQGYEQFSPFDLVLLAIIRAHPKEGKRNTPDANEYERLRQARRAQERTLIALWVSKPSAIPSDADVLVTAR